ncbi:methylated-DNA--[protein]-cysteine S-methyltransferase [Geothrix sp. 21YS21S-4]|uniref:methylated-DNA--[protein]-cysteine S-methyltransferase n=1 Tax=Geothrix sp. 21YS21S-4 TaxID=3068889 RepID=UPI0027BA8C9E|nr:methylated-DNA--[protein]-cysteine S-methyltransferase [Geothrix sp. 21YS21S-4]
MPGSFHPLATPLGDLGAAFDEDGRLVQLIRLHGRPPAVPAGPVPKSLPYLKRQMDAYFSGNLRDFNIPMLAEGTDFQRRVWKELQKIPYGQAISYLELARRLGDEKCIRAAARANGANPLIILIPCHRVIGSDGSLVGYGGGLDMKEYLLRLEGVLPKAPPQPALPLEWL